MVMLYDIVFKQDGAPIGHGKSRWTFLFNRDGDRPPKGDRLVALKAHLNVERVIQSRKLSRRGVGKATVNAVVARGLVGADSEQLVAILKGAHHIIER